MAFLEEGRVGDRTWVGVSGEKKRDRGGTTLPATMDPSAARSSTNGAPKQWPGKQMFVQPRLFLVGGGVMGYVPTAVYFVVSVPKRTPMNMRRRRDGAFSHRISL